MLGVLAGYGYRDVRLAESQVFYRDVYIHTKVSDSRFLIQPARMLPLDSTLCPGSTVDWKQGETISYLRFEQKHGCKRIIAYGRYPEQGAM